MSEIRQGRVLVASHKINSRGSSVVEQKTENLCVASPILAPGTSNLRFTPGRGAVGSARGLGP